MHFEIPLFFVAEPFVWAVNVREASENYMHQHDRIQMITSEKKSSHTNMHAFRNRNPTNSGFQSHNCAQTKNECGRRKKENMHCCIDCKCNLCHTFHTFVHARFSFLLCSSSQYFISCIFFRIYCWWTSANAMSFTDKAVNFTSKYVQCLRSYFEY